MRQGHWVGLRLFAVVALALLSVGSAIGPSPLLVRADEGIEQVTDVAGDTSDALVTAVDDTTAAETTTDSEAVEGDGDEPSQTVSDDSESTTESNQETGSEEATGEEEGDSNESSQQDESSTSDEAVSPPLDDTGEDGSDQSDGGNGTAPDDDGTTDGSGDDGVATPDGDQSDGNATPGDDASPPDDQSPVEGDATPEGPDSDPDESEGETEGEASPVPGDVSIAGAGVGNITVLFVDELDDPQRGPCVTIHEDDGGGTLGNAVADTCDDDGAGEDGVAELAGIAAGDYVAVESNLPDGYDPAPNQTFTLEAGANLILHLQSTPSADDDDTGTVIITAVDSDSGDTLVGGCYQIFTEDDGAFVASGCDRNDDADGVATIADLAPGNYIARATQSPVGYLVGGEFSFAIESGEDTTLEASFEPGGATVRVHKVDENGGALGGACFLIREDSGGTLGAFLTSNCDGPSNESGDGLILIQGVPAGDYWLVEYQAPNGYARADARQFSIGTDDLDLTVENEPAGGDLIISKVDQNGDPLGGACFNAQPTGGGNSGFACDNSDGDDDGTITIAGLLPGGYQLYEAYVPEGYVGSGPISIEIDPTDETTVTVENTIGGQLAVTKVDENGDVLPGACFNVHPRGDFGTTIAFSCDASDGANDGAIYFANLPTGDLTLGENFVPVGYSFGAPVDFSVDAGDTAEITFENRPGGQALFVYKTDTEGNTLPGACFQVQLDLGGGEQGGARAGGCDSYDGANDGTVTLAGLQPGDYILVETFAPFGYAIANPVSFTLVDREDRELTVEDAKLQPGEYGTLVIRKVDADGNLLTGACFELLNPVSGEPVTSEPHCDGGFGDMDGGANNGEVVFENNVRGSFILREAVAPDGYTAAADIEVTIDAQETVTVDIVNVRTGEEAPVDADDEDNEDNEDNETADVTTLPDTGVGPMHANSSAMLALGVFSLALLGFAYASTRAKPRRSA